MLHNGTGRDPKQTAQRVLWHFVTVISFCIVAPAGHQIASWPSAEGPVCTPLLSDHAACGLVPLGRGTEAAGGAANTLGHTAS